MQTSRIISQALDLWQNPALTELSIDAIVDSTNRCFSRHSIDLDLTADIAFYTAKSDVFTFPDTDAREIVLAGIPIDDISRIIRVESRGDTSTNEDDWEEVVLASYDNWNEIQDRYGDFVSFYRGSEGIVMVTNRDGSRIDYRIVYHALRDRIEAPDAVADIPSAYENLFVYDLGLEFAELIDNRSPEFQQLKRTKMPFLMQRYQDEFERMEKWRRNQRGSGITHRRAFDDRLPGVRTGARKFAVRF